VLLGHGGISPDPASPGDDERLAALLSGVDLVLAGHTHLEGGPRVVVAADGSEVPIVAAAAYGRTVGRVELLLKEGQRPRLVEDQTAFLPVDDRVVPTASTAIRGLLSAVIAGIEAEFLPGTLSVIEGAAVEDDPAIAGDLYFRALAHTAFDVPGLRQPGETNGLNLSTDALRASAEALAGDTEIALQNSGSVRADLFAGDVSMADVYRMAPLGADPTTGTPGYPVIRIFVTTAELRAALEGTLGMSFLGAADFYLSPAGLRVVYDPTRPPFDPADPLGPGWITALALVGADGVETPLYDASAAIAGLPAGWTSNPGALRSVATTYYVGAFAEAFGVTLRDATGAPVALEDAILTWPGTTATVKDHQVLGRYVKGACAANGGELPSAYDEGAPEGVVPRRILCEGVACP
jgi:hypothetical protein